MGSSTVSQQRYGPVHATRLQKGEEKLKIISKEIKIFQKKLKIIYFCIPLRQAWNIETCEYAIFDGTQKRGALMEDRFSVYGNERSARRQGPFSEAPPRIAGKTSFDMEPVRTIWKKTCVMMRDIALAVADLMFPRECIVCGRTLNFHEKYLCIYCEADLPLTYFWKRRRNPMSDKVNALIQKRLPQNDLADTERMRPHGPENNPSGIRGKSDAAFSYAAALIYYHGENGYKRIPQRLKYMGDLGEGRFFAEMLGVFLKESELFRDVDLLIPVPLHRARRWSRGYNQAEVVARALAGKMGGLPVRTDMLRRKRRTKTQTRLGVEEKALNVRGAFALTRKFAGLPPERRDGMLLRCRHVLLVDDVFTTGATMDACLSVLQPFFGPEVRISCATLGAVDSG